MGYIAFDFTQLPSYNDLEIPLTRASRLIARLESLDDIAFQFSSIRPYSRFPSKKLGKLCQAFAHILNLVMDKSCSKLQFAHLDTSPLGEHYSFKRSDKPPNGILTHFKGYFKDGAPAKAKLIEEDIRYTRSTRLGARMPHILPSPQSLEMAAKLTRLDTGSINLFRPPFSAWIFPILQASGVTHLSIGMKDLPADKEESQYILDRLAAAVPNIILLTIYSIVNQQVYDILSWIGKFPKLGTLSLPLNFPTKLEVHKIDLHLPDLWRFECASELLPVLFEEECRVNFPKLNSVAITHYGFDVALLAESIPRAREMIRKKSGGLDCLLFLALRLTAHDLQSKVTPAMRDGVRPTHKTLDFSKGFEGVSPLELSLPGTREDIRLGILDNDIMVAQPALNDMLVVGLTGGIATGKSTVSNLLKSRGIPVVDADVIARQVVEPGTPALAKIEAHFGPQVIQADGSLDRKQLGSIIFNDAAQRAKLNAIVHPAVRKAMGWEVVRYWFKGEKICVMDVPLLIEGPLHKMVGKVVVVYCSEEIQLQRLIQRDNSTREDALSRLRSQMPIADKVAYADVVLDNSGTHQDLEAQVADLLRRLDKEIGWTWRISWLFPPFAIASAALLLLWRTVKRRRRNQRRKRG
ncbi:hypothetical protein EST38_g8320 [Candolleomyces aberdarensis]|uniref:Dephospho-CoA kinase n=1 Tax=Candolleomyces aberdarensis TaxID=2316362 RepID=A0A4Q2DFN7_9AGAR|nr:hypothetical protein EST38_g8320 [Candolleomyces aberdarensis]